jgi:hypothetical protein
LYVQFQPYPHGSSFTAEWCLRGVARSCEFQGCGNDRLGQIQPSDLWCEELVHLAARPLITRITHIEGIPEESRGGNISMGSVRHLTENMS